MDKRRREEETSETILKEEDNDVKSEEEEEEKDVKVKRLRTTEHDAPSPRSGSDAEDEEEDGAQDSEDEDDEEEEEEDEEVERSTARRKKRRRPLNPFIEEEAAVDDDEEEEFDEGDEEPEVAREELEELEKNYNYLDERRHRKLDMKMQREDDIDAEALAEQLKQRYSRADYGVFRGDKDVIPQSVLIPSIQDPKLGMVKVRTGKERDIVYTLMKRFINLENTDKPLRILSCFCRNGIPGYIYVEGDRPETIEEALVGVQGVYNRTLKIVPVQEMTQCLTIKSKEKELLVNSWVRIKRGKYAGDLGQIVNLDSAEMVTIKLVPRLDPPGSTKDATKRKKNELRPVPKRFNHKEYEGSREFEARDGGYYYQSDFYTKDGYLEKTLKVQSLQTDSVNPSLEEVTNFSGGAVEDGGEDVALLGAVAAATVEDFKTGETVEVVSGELGGVLGVVQSVQNGVVTVLPDKSLGWAEALEFPARELRKKFAVGDHVKVATGVYKGLTGLVINIENTVANILSDADLKPITVFTKDLVAATEITTSEVLGSQYSEDDFIQISLEEVGMVLKVGKDNLTVLNQYGMVVNVKPQQARPRGEMRKAVANDRNGMLFSSGDQVEIIDGPPVVLRKRATVLYVYRKFVFLKSREIVENRGIYVTTSDCVNLFGVRAVPNGLSFNQNQGYSNGRGRGGSNGGPRGDRILHKNVQITGGPYKGYKGVVKHATDSMARVELQALSRTVNVERSRIRLVEETYRSTPTGQTDDVWGSSANRFNGGMTPAAWDSGRTPMHGGAKTPMHREGDGRTPAWVAGSKTPGWDSAGNGSVWGVSSRTPSADRPPDRSGFSSQYHNALADAPNPSSGWGEDSGSFSKPNGTQGIHSGNDEAQVPVEEVDWITTDIEVKVIPSGRQKFKDGQFDTVTGVIKRIDGPGRALVKLANGEAPLTIPSEFLEPVAPEKRDAVKIIGREHREEIGSLIGVDGLDGIVKLTVGGTGFKVMPMKDLAKHVP